MGREYKILTSTAIGTLEDQIEATSKLRGFKVEGFAFDGTNYVALVSFEV